MKETLRIVKGADLPKEIVDNFKLSANDQFPAIQTKNGYILCLKKGDLAFAKKYCKNPEISIK